MGTRFGRYETLQPIASGGMATVHLARALGVGGFERLVAVKVMHAGLDADPEFVAMFLDEARVAARIRHPNVVATLDMEQGPDGLFLVMEFVEGPSLSAMVRALARKSRGLPIGVALRVMIDALLGLHAAHEQTGASGEPLNVVHRDVSPHNILVGLDGVTKITDFGVARAEARLSSTRGGEIKGKLAYMSPQQVRSEPIDRRADVYAAGVVLWELLARQRLFTGDNDGALVMAVVQGALRTPRQVDEGVPEPVDRACMRALSIDPDERFPTALAFAEALELAAEEARVPLATPRALAAFVKDLGAHSPVVVPRAASEVAPPAPPETATRVDPNSHVSSVVSAVHEKPRAEGRRRLVAGIAVMGSLLVASALLGARFLAAPATPATPATSTPAAAPSATETAAPMPKTAAPLPEASSAAPPSASAARPPAPPKAVPSTKAAPPRPRSGDDWRPQGL